MSYTSPEGTFINELAYLAFKAKKDKLEKREQRLNELEAQKALKKLKEDRRFQQNELNKEKIGKKAYFKVDSFEFEVEVIDYKFEYGRDRWLVTPSKGTGRQWIQTIFF